MLALDHNNWSIPMLSVNLSISCYVQESCQLEHCSVTAEFIHIKSRVLLYYISKLEFFLEILTFKIQYNSLL